ncbi:MAG: hypothetical protein V2B14_01255 [bacterium]
MPYKFEYQKENSSSEKLSEENHDFLVGFIAEKWDKWNDLRRSNLEINSEVEKAIYPSFRNLSAKQNIEMPEIYEVRETYKAHLWKSWFSSLDSMFDVQGKAREDHFMAARQKASLIDVFRSINFVSKLEKGLDNWINKGEFIAFISWSTKVKQTRRKGFFTNEENYDYGNGSDAEAYIIKDEIIYDGPDFTIVAPEAFVFDASKADNFDVCPKIYRSWATYDEISANKLYQNHEDLAALSAQEGAAEPHSQATNPSFEEGKATKGDQFEILEYWGDIKLKDGSLLKNHVVTLAGRKKIIRFEPNPFIINPFIFASFLEDPVTKRGISPLCVALPLNKISTTILNLQLDALKLIINKPYLAPKGSLSGKINIKEGSIIEYDPALMPREPIPLEFGDALVGWEFLKFFESKIESATGIFKYMIGDAKGVQQRTATEASGIMLGQNIRLSKEIDVLNFRVKVPVVQKIAELLANFSFDSREIKVFKSNGDVDFVLVDESVRQGKYDYIIGDSSAIFERKAKLKENLEVLYEFAKHPEVSPMIKWIDVLKWTFEQLGSADPNMFIKTSEGG